MTYRLNRATRIILKILEIGQSVKDFALSRPIFPKNDPAEGFCDGNVGRVSQLNVLFPRSAWERTEWPPTMSTWCPGPVSVTCWQAASSVTGLQSGHSVRDDRAPCSAWSASSRGRHGAVGRTLLALPVLGAKWTGNRAGVPPLGGIAAEIPPKGGTPATVLRRSHLIPEEPLYYWFAGPRVVDRPQPSLVSSDVAGAVGGHRGGVDRRSHIHLGKHPDLLAGGKDVKALEPGM